MVNVDKRLPRWWQILLQAIMPALILAIVTWIASSMVQTTTDLKVYRAETVLRFDAIQKEIKGVREDLTEHNEITRKESLRNAVDHHREMMTPCNKCHDGSGRKR